MRQTEQSKIFLQEPGIHAQWESDYLNAGLDGFYDAAFDDILARIKPSPDSLILDAGCGYGYHTKRLARAGAKIIGIDFSEPALAHARVNVSKAGLERQITLQRADITALPFADDTFDHVVCWGVLMHVPDLEIALSELSRVTRCGGFLVLAENNARSLDVVVREPIIRWLKVLLRRPIPKVHRSQRGIETWSDSASGGLLVRKAFPEFLRATLARHGVQQLARTSGQFTEVYTNVRSTRAKRLIYSWNTFYYKHVRYAPLAVGNILFYQKSTRSAPSM